MIRKKFFDYYYKIMTQLFYENDKKRASIYFNNFEVVAIFLMDSGCDFVRDYYEDVYKLYAQKFLGR